MKICNRRGKSKPKTAYFADRANKSTGTYSICKECKKNAVNDWRKNNRLQYNASMRAYNKKHYYRLRLQRYDLTVEQHTALLAEQKGKCAICRKLPNGKRPLAVDHNHKTGKVRGLLCYGCNRALHVLDAPGLLKAAEAYLKKHS